MPTFAGLCEFAAQARDVSPSKTGQIAPPRRPVSLTMRVCADILKKNSNNAETCIFSQSSL
jgi:hypothetical protein